MEILGQSLAEIRNKIFAEILHNKDFMRSVIVENTDYLEADLTPKQQEILNNPNKAVREYIYPYKRMFDTTTEKHTIVTTGLSEFIKDKVNYRNGKLTFYILVPVPLEKTDYGIRTDCIGDILEHIFANTQIGEFNVYDRGDMDIGAGYIGQYITFRITDFHIVRN